MNNLKELIGRKVIALIDDFEVEGNVIDVFIDDFFFESKNESIYINVNITPTDLPIGLEYEDCNSIPLEHIRKSNT
jgi:hypothetical protein